MVVVPRERFLTSSSLCPQRRFPSPGQVGDFEAKLRDGRSPALNQPLSKETSAADRAEFAIISLGWARQHLIVPPKAAKYVTVGIAALFLMLAVSIINLLLTVFWFGLPAGR